MAWYRDDADVPRLKAGFGLWQAAAYRYAAKGREVLAAQAPGPEEALEQAVKEGTPPVILDGRIVTSDRCREKKVSRKGREIDRWYSGKEKDFGGNIQGLIGAHVAEFAIFAVRKPFFRNGRRAWSFESNLCTVCRLC